MPMESYSYELIWEGGNKNEIVSKSDYLASNTDLTREQWTVDQLIEIVDDITLDGECPKRIELHITVDNPIWYDTAFKCVSELYHHVIDNHPHNPDYIVPFID